MPELRLGKTKSAMCFHVRSFVSFESTSKGSSSGVNLGFRPADLDAIFGMPGFPTTDKRGSRPWELVSCQSNWMSRAHVALTGSGDGRKNESSR
jgi:hypothetical protein